MAENKAEISTVPGDSVSGEIKPEETRSQKKARLAEVYNRGIIGDRLHVPLPPDKYGQWVREDDVDRLKTFGFWVDNEYSKGRALHDKGDASNRVGDTVFMVCERETKEILDELRREKYNSTHAPKGGKQKEEKDFKASVGAEDGPIDASKVTKADLRDISDAVKAALDPSNSQ